MTLSLRAIGVLAALALTAQGPAPIPLEAGMVIDRSVTIRPYDTTGFAELRFDIQRK